MKQLLEKTAVKANTLITDSNSSVRCYIVKFLFLAYFILGTLACAGLLANFVLHVKYSNSVAQIDKVKLNGWSVYLPAKGSIVDNNGRIIIRGPVERLGVKSDVIYGQYDDMQQDTLYFICKRGDVCTDSSRLDKNKYDLAVKEEGLRKLIYPFYDDRISLVTKEWVKRKIAFQVTTDAPFLPNPSNSVTGRLLSGISFVFAIFTFWPYSLAPIACLCALCIYAYKRRLLIGNLLNRPRKIKSLIINVFRLIWTLYKFLILIIIAYLFLIVVARY